MTEFAPPAANIIAVLEEIGGNFPDRTAENVRELVEHNEPGVALSILCSQIFEYGIELSTYNRSRLTLAACLMGIPLLDLDGLAD